jgi:archaellum component FlaG (FlaF/FlaG flagellin family)
VDKVLATALLSIASVIAATMIATTTMPMLARNTDAMTAATTSMADQMKTSVSVVYATGDATKKQLYLWVKNVGLLPVQAPARSDLFLQTPAGSYDRMTYAGGPYGSANNWQFALQDGNMSWDPSTTIKITISLASAPSGQYQAVLVLPNGVSAQSIFSI